MDSGSGQDQSFVEQARRLQIVEAAISVIAEAGLATASSARIARAAGVSPALINYHFGSREALLREVLTVADARMDRAMSGGPSEPASYAEALRRIVVGYVQQCVTHPAEVAAAQAIRDGSVNGPSEDGPDEMIAFLTEAQREGEFGSFDPAVFTQALFAAMVAVPPQLVDRTPAECVALAEELASLFIRSAVAVGHEVAA